MILLVVSGGRQFYVHWFKLCVYQSCVFKKPSKELYMRHGRFQQ